MSQRLVIGIVVLCATLVACKRLQPNFCPTARDENCLELDAQPSGYCSDSHDCFGAAAICDPSSHACVQCTSAETSACTGSAPVCGTDHVCRGCTAHSQCPSSVCLPGGSCGDESMVAYVENNGIDSNICSRLLPCKSVMRALATNLPYIKLHGIIDEAVSINGGRVVTFLADPGSKLTRRTGIGAILTVQDDRTSLSIYDLEISDAPNNPSGIGCVIPPASGAPSLTLIRSKISNNPGGGISAAAGALTVSQSVVSGNAGGGISISGGSFVIVGNVFFNNGWVLSSVGGVLVNTVANFNNRLEFNSFSQNLSQNGTGPAVQCVAGPFTARNNIMLDNHTPSSVDQVGGTCSHSYSIMHPGAVPIGVGNMASDPLLVTPTVGDLHIRPDSPARNAADPNSELSGIASHDIDGDIRVSPADIGADEIR